MNTIRFVQRVVAKLGKKNTSKEQVMLGRWGLSYDENQVATKVRWANEDHCGVCSDYQPTHIIVRTVENSQYTQRSK